MKNARKALRAIMALLLILPAGLVAPAEASAAVDANCLCQAESDAARKVISRYLALAQARLERAIGFCDGAGAQEAVADLALQTFISQGPAPVNQVIPPLPNFASSRDYDKLHARVRAKYQKAYDDLMKANPQGVNIPDLPYLLDMIPSGVKPSGLQWEGIWRLKVAIAFSSLPYIETAQNKILLVKRYEIIRTMQQRIAMAVKAYLKAAIKQIQTIKISIDCGQSAGQLILAKQAAIFAAATEDALSIGGYARKEYLMKEEMLPKCREYTEALYNAEVAYYTAMGCRLVKRLGLHSARFSYTDPDTGEERTIESEGWFDWPGTALNGAGREELRESCRESINPLTCSAFIKSEDMVENALSKVTSDLNEVWVKYRDGLPYLAPDLYRINDSSATAKSIWRRERDAQQNRPPEFRNQLVFEGGVEAGQKITLCASTLTQDKPLADDADNDTLRYKWKISAVPGFSQRYLETEIIVTGDTAEFTPDISGIWGIKLIADDGLTTSGAEVFQPKATALASAGSRRKVKLQAQGGGVVLQQAGQATSGIKVGGVSLTLVITQDDKDIKLEKHLATKEEFLAAQKAFDLDKEYTVDENSIFYLETAPVTAEIIDEKGTKLEQYRSGETRGVSFVTTLEGLRFMGDYTGLFGTSDLFDVKNLANRDIYHVGPGSFELKNAALGNKKAFDISITVYDPNIKKLVIRHNGQCSSWERSGNSKLGGILQVAANIDREELIKQGDNFTLVPKGQATAMLNLPDWADYSLRDAVNGSKFKSYISKMVSSGKHDAMWANPDNPGVIYINTSWLSGDGGMRFNFGQPIASYAFSQPALSRAFMNHEGHHLYYFTNIFNSSGSQKFTNLEKDADADQLPNEGAYFEYLLDSKDNKHGPYGPEKRRLEEENIVLMHFGDKAYDKVLIVGKEGFSGRQKIRTAIINSVSSEEAKRLEAGNGFESSVFCGLDVLFPSWPVEYFSPLRIWASSEEKTPTAAWQSVDDTMIAYNLCDNNANPTGKQPVGEFILPQRIPKPMLKFTYKPSEKWKTICQQYPNGFKLLATLKVTSPHDACEYDASREEGGKFTNYWWRK